MRVDRHKPRTELFFVAVARSTPCKGVRVGSGSVKRRREVSRVGVDVGSDEVWGCLSLPRTDVGSDEAWGRLTLPRTDVGSDEAWGRLTLPRTDVGSDEA